ncbi:hypothetical protein [Hymenobacter lucidus]|uniref:DUF4397 domain-containing protein n=1 Tax=Hymenobacter lucidus TaxID=2880930 RepID=A0ABS8AS92_9BACT|nr:hypothetical protein [Hymenobacter lucidus]MCB2409085.1 hypothetical protein [Hymenobacter lucidus]
MRFIYPAFALLTLLSSCDTEKTAEPTIAGHIQLRALEGRTPQGRALFLSFQDEGQYACSNYGLSTDYQRTGPELSFAFSGAIEPADICLTSIGPARARVDITTLPEGSYPLRLRVGSRSTTGTLELQSSYVRLSTADPSLVEVTLPELRFMPAKTIWGAATTALPASQVSVEVLRDSLQRLGATPTTLPPGTYSQVTIGPNGLPVPSETSPGFRSLLLVASYAGSAERIQAYVRRANAATPGLNLSINTSAL